MVAWVPAITHLSPMGTVLAAHHRHNVGGWCSSHNAPNEFFGSCNCNGGFFILWRIRPH